MRMHSLPQYMCSTYCSDCNNKINSFEKYGDFVHGLQAKASFLSYGELLYVCMHSST